MKRGILKSEKRVDTSIEGYSYIGIKLTQEQLTDLAYINLMIREKGILEDNPVHGIILVMKTLGLIPPEMKCGIDDDYPTDNSPEYFQHLFERKFGRFKD